jgi:hypothetical protein
MQDAAVSSPLLLADLEIALFGTSAGKIACIT